MVEKVDTVLREAAPVAQLDSASVFGTEGCRFESYRACSFIVGAGNPFPGPFEDDLLWLLAAAGRSFFLRHSESESGLVGAVCWSPGIWSFHVNQLACYIEWAVLAFIKNFSQVESDDSQVGENQSTDKYPGNHRAGPAVDVDTMGVVANDSISSVQEGNSRHQEPDVNGESQRFV